VPLLPLFDSGETILADDALGRIVYTPGFVGEHEARAWFTALREAVPWKAERRQMYDREVDVPRLTGHFRLAPRDPAESIPPAILEAAQHVIPRTGVPFNSVGLNFYRDGKDSVAPHNDHLTSIVEGQPIGLLSLGSARRMTIRAKQPPTLGVIKQGQARVIHVDLAPGSLLMMSYETQLHYTHGIPKTKDAVGERISLAFRVKPADGEGFYR
jgi:alkylated DNA repair dioxygenase AlkB